MDLLISLFTIIAQHLRLLVAVFLVALVMVTAGIYVRRINYESTAKILINMEGRGVSLSHADVQYGSTIVQAVEAMTSQVEILKSRELLEEVVDRVGIETFSDPPPTNVLLRLVFDAIGALTETVSDALVYVRLIDPVSPRDALIGRLDRALKVYPVRQAQIIVLSFQWRRPDIPPQVLGALIEAYLRKVVEINGFSDGQTVFVEQARRSNSELRAAERALRDFEIRYGITDLRREKQDLVEHIERLTTFIEGLSPSTVTSPETATPVPAPGRAPVVLDTSVGGGQLGQLLAKLNALKVDRAKLVVSYTSETRDVRELDSQIAEISNLLKRETTIVVDTVGQLRDRLRLLQEIEANYDALNRDIEIAREAYQTYRKVSEDRRVMMAEEAHVRVQVIDPPFMPRVSVGPSRLIMLLAGVGVSLLLALFAVLVVDVVQREVARRRLAARSLGEEPDDAVHPPPTALIARPFLGS